jgi:hypothetical protein
MYTFIILPGKSEERVTSKASVLPSASQLSAVMMGEVA